MNDGVTQFIRIGFALQQIKQSIFTDIFLAIKMHGKAGVQVAIVPELVIEVFMDIMEIAENGFIRSKLNQCSVGFSCFGFFMFFNQEPFFKLRCFFFTIAKAVTLKRWLNAFTALVPTPFNPTLF